MIGYRFYIATRFANKEAGRNLSIKLAMQGNICTARWLWRDEGADKGVGSRWKSTDLSALAVDYSRQDLEDISIADVVYVLTDNCEGVPGGMWVEMGYALALNKKVLLVGPYQNIFCHLLEKYNENF